MIPKPVGKRVFAELAGGERDKSDDKLCIAGRQPIAVEHQKGFADDRRRPLVAIDKGMVARNAMGVGSGEFGTIGIAIGGAVARPGKRAFQGTGIAQAIAAAMFGKLFGVDGDRRGIDDPCPIPCHPKRAFLLGELAQSALALRHHLARRRHLRVEIGIGRA